MHAKIGKWHLLYLQDYWALDMLLQYSLPQVTCKCAAWHLHVLSLTTRLVQLVLRTKWRSFSEHALQLQLRQVQTECRLLDNCLSLQQGSLFSFCKRLGSKTKVVTKCVTCCQVYDTGNGLLAHQIWWSLGNYAQPCLTWIVQRAVRYMTAAMGS